MKKKDVIAEAVVKKSKNSLAFQEELQKAKPGAKKAVKQREPEQRIGKLCTKIKQELRAMNGINDEAVINKYGLHMLTAQVASAHLLS